MSEPRVKLAVSGLDEHIRQLKRIGHSLAGAVIEAALEGGQVIADQANENLGKGEVVQVVLNPGETTAQRAVVDIGLVDEKWYLRFLEYGTSPHEVSPDTAAALRFITDIMVFSKGHVVAGVAARPFLRPAVDTTRNRVGKAMAAVYDRIIKAAV